MTQDIQHMASISQKKSANHQQLLELEASGEGSPSSLSSSHDSEDISLLREQLTAANNNIAFLQKEHGAMLRGLHAEIERLQDLCKDLQFRCEMAGCLLPDSEFFRCSPKVLEQKVGDLILENTELRRKLSESLQAIDILDQKEKLALWQHHQELEQRDNAIVQLEKELEDKSALVAQLTSTAQQGARRKKTNFWRRFSFSSSNNTPSTSAAPPKVVHPQRVEHLSKEDLPSEMQGNFPGYESQYQSYSSYSSLSDKSVSDDEGLGHRFHHAESRIREKLKDSASLGKSVKLPPIHGLQIRPQARQPLRCAMGKPSQDSLAIDQIKSTDVPVKRTGKI